MRDKRIGDQRTSAPYSIRLSHIRLSDTLGAPVFSGTVSPKRTRDAKGCGLSDPGYAAPAINGAFRLCPNLLGRPVAAGCRPK